MIRANHQAIDTQDALTIYGISLRTFRRRMNTPTPDQPTPINPTHGSRGHRQLWDAEEIRAHAEGRPLPPHTTEDHPQDLLDRTEIATLINIHPDTFAKDPYAPPPDHTIYDIPHWYRHTIEHYRDNRPGKGHPRTPPPQP
ncbi:hypothetical protein [Embleya scabrispora]|uniref:hypothetical protein n=1 Tax=Embleya scabrispora TaxID=159449 RepID=UPI000376215D|nr:hypothetical protein [Embleya scabrispora]MYS81039.1 hypothetical protein [Streptomyces sp. SID5474]